MGDYAGLEKSVTAGAQPAASKLQSIFQTAMKSAAHQVIGECARARKIALGEVSLPIHPYLTEEEIGRVIEVCNRWGG